MLVPEQANTFIVNSPFQLLCAVEARSVLCTGQLNHLIILRMERIGSLGHRQFLNIIDSNWHSVTFIDFENKRGIARHLQKLRLFAQLAKPRKPARIFIGNGRLAWLRTISQFVTHNIVELDDGAASIRILSDARQKAVKISSSKLTHFSLFSDEADEPWAKKNTLSVLAQFRSLLPRSDGTEVYAVGQKLSEESFLSLDSELIAWRAFSDRFPGRVIVYIPHRGDSSQKIARIKDLGFCVRDISLPLEQHLATVSEAPAAIGSFFSTTLFTTKHIDPSIQRVSLRPHMEFPSIERKREIEIVYDRIKQDGIEVIELG